MRPFSVPHTAFIVGSPRSGTTILGECLGGHPQIAHFYEPYYVWDYFGGRRDHDIKGVQDATEEAKAFIRRKFQLFSRKSHASLVVDKSPEHCFAIPYVREVFPEAKWIHILRDGRDVILSINKKWKIRQNWVEKKDYLKFRRVLKVSFILQPFWHFRFLQILYELKSGKSIKPSFYLNKSKWRGYSGWGPRFPGWEQFLRNHSVLEFNAMQWVKCIEYVSRYLKAIPSAQVLEVRYEDLISRPNAYFHKILDFLEMPKPSAFWENLPKLNAKNTWKWKEEFSRKDLQEIAPFISPHLMELDYETDLHWHENA